VIAVNMYPSEDDAKKLANSIYLKKEIPGNQSRKKL
jgi:hypothetical protein